MFLSVYKYMEMHRGLIRIDDSKVYQIHQNPFLISLSDLNLFQ